MATDGTYGDDLTLRAASNIHNVEITLVSSLGNESQLGINPTEFQSFERIVLGHFAEAYREHYRKQPPQMFLRKSFLKIFLQNSQENTCARVSFSIKLQP